MGKHRDGPFVSKKTWRKHRDGPFVSKETWRRKQKDRPHLPIYISPREMNRFRRNSGPISSEGPFPAGSVKSPSCSSSDPSLADPDPPDSLPLRSANRSRRRIWRASSGRIYPDLRKASPISCSGRRFYPTREQRHIKIVSSAPMEKS